MIQRPESQPALLRRTIYYSGRVQGVGFRFTTEAIASRLSICGFVRNLPDGRVEVVAEGTEMELGRFQGEIHDAMRGNIREVEAADGTATGKFTSFRIAF